MRCLWSINERLAGGDGLDVELPDMAMMMQDCFDLCRMEEEAIQEMQDRAKIREQHFEAIS